jgi:hypothetical protein
MTEIQNLKTLHLPKSEFQFFCHWHLECICNLVLGIWNLCQMNQSIEYHMEEKGGLNLCLFLEIY